MYLWHCFRVLKRLRDPVACEQPFRVRGGELSPHSPCSCAGDLELKAEGVGWSAVWLKVYDIRKKTLNVIRGSKIESWSNGDGNENGKKAIGLNWQNNNLITLHVHHAFLYISLPSLHDYDVKLPNFTVCEGVNTRQRPSFSSPEL